MTVGEFRVEVVYKPIKHAYLRVDRTTGRVRVSAPLRMAEREVRQLAESRLGWIRRQHQRLVQRGDCGEPAFVSGETHYLQGRPYSLRVVQHPGRPSVRVVDERTVELRVRPDAPLPERRAALERWYRQHLRDVLPGLVRAWAPVMGVSVAEWRIKRMKTRWGSCNIRDRRIWLNLALARKPAECLEYVLVHEMTHLLERGHNARFYRLMDGFLPDWRTQRDRLNQAGP